MNLANRITLIRIFLVPIIMFLLLINVNLKELSFEGFTISWNQILAALIFIVAASTDGLDGYIARKNKIVTNLGKLLDPLADKLLLVATLVPMYWLMRDSLFTSLPQSNAWAAGETVGAIVAGGGERRLLFPFVTPLGLVGLPFWILAVVLLREVLMTFFRQYAARRGVVIAAVGPAKLKTIFQMIWVGAAFFWFMASTAAMEHGWRGSAWHAFALFNGIVGTLSMVGAISLTIYSMWLYWRTYGSVISQPVLATASGRPSRPT